MALGALAIPAQAAVSFVSSLPNDSSSEISEWSKTGTAKSSDLDGNNYYGSDGYSWMNASGSGGTTTVFASLVESAPSYTSGIAYTGSGAGSSSYSGSYGAGTDDRFNPEGTGTANFSVGYAGINYSSTTGATVLQEIFSYTMNRNMSVGETIRLGVVLDSLLPPRRRRHGHVFLRHHGAQLGRGNPDLGIPEHGYGRPQRDHHRWRHLRLGFGS